MLFDNILARGFSPQVFISGLNAHLRDLLMAKGPAIALVEFTGTLVERYKQQAQRCDEQFLFNAISLLTEADGKIRQSSNQRLLVELGLMKIAGLGQKKNEGVADGIEELSFDTRFELPELVAPAQPQPQQPVQSQPVQPQSVQPQSAPAPAQSVAPASAAVAPEVKRSVAKSEEQRPVRPATLKQRVGGLSLNNLLGGGAKTATELIAEAEAESKSVVSSIDPACQEKIMVAKERIIEALTRTRQRYGVFFDAMVVDGNVVRVSVPSEPLAADIMHDKAELQRIFAEHSGAVGLIEIEVTVNERVRISRPITLEDRLRHLMEKNERLKEMIETLELDAE